MISMLPYRLITTLEQFDTNDSARPLHLNGLRITLQVWFVRTGSMDDLKGAIYAHDHALQVTSPEHSNYMSYLNDNGLALLAK